MDAEAADDPEQDRPGSHVRDPGDSMAERHARVLAELADILMDVAREARQTVVAAAPQDKAQIAGEIGPLITRIARAVRQTVAIEARLNEQRLMRAQTAAAEIAARTAAQAGQAEHARRGRELNRRDIVARVVEQAIDAETDPDDGDPPDDGGPRDRENLVGDLYERLDDYESYYRFTDLPVGALAARLCKAMGLNPDWNRWRNEDWAIAEARENPPGSPFAAAPEDDRPAEERQRPAAKGRGPPAET